MCPPGDGKSLWSNTGFKASASLLICCLDVLFIGESGLLEFPTIIALLSIFSFRSVNICSIYLGAPTLGAEYL